MLSKLGCRGHRPATQSRLSAERSKVMAQRERPWLASYPSDVPHTLAPYPERLGAVAVGNNPLYTRREMAHQLADAGIETLIVLDVLYPTIGKIRNEVGLKQVVVTEIGDYLPFPINKLARMKQRREARHEGPPWPPVPADHEVIPWPDLLSRATSTLPPLEVGATEDIAALVYTGGTTGL